MYILMTASIHVYYHVLLRAVWLVLAVVTILDILSNKDHTLSVGSQLLWIVIIILVPIIGPLAYLAWKEYKKHQS